MKDSGVSMTLDNEFSDESQDTESAALRGVLKDLHKQSPQDKLPKQDLHLSGAEHSAEYHVKRNLVISDETSEKTSQNWDENNASEPNEHIDMKPDGIGIFNETKEDKGIKTNKAGISNRLDNDLLQYSIHREMEVDGANPSYSRQRVLNSDPDSDLGQIYFQERNGSKTLEIYNNAVLSKNFPDTSARKGTRKTDL